MDNPELVDIGRNPHSRPCLTPSSLLAESCQSGPPMAGPFLTNPLLKQFRPVLPERETQQILLNRGVPKFSSTAEVSNEDKISALASLPAAYRASIDGTRFAQRVVAQVLTSLNLRNPQDPRYRRFYYSHANVMRGGKIIAMPDFLQSLTGSGFVLAGPSGVGKTAFLQRLRVLLGERHSVLWGDGDMPAEYVLVPMLIIQWPDCGTRDGLLENLRNALIRELGCAQTEEHVFSNFRGRHAVDAAIATCVLVNLGLFVLDGMCNQSRFGECREILDFVATFKARSGITTIISCTHSYCDLMRTGLTKSFLLAPFLATIRRSTKGGETIRTTLSPATWVRLTNCLRQSKGVTHGALWTEFCP